MLFLVVDLIKNYKWARLVILHNKRFFFRTKPTEISACKAWTVAIICAKCWICSFIVKNYKWAYTVILHNNSQPFMLSLQLKTGLSCEIMTYFCASRWKCSFILKKLNYSLDYIILLKFNYMLWSNYSVPPVKL